MKLTPWFPADVKPVRPGVYEMRCDPPRWYRRWDGRHWYIGDTNVSVAAKETLASWCAFEMWRGLAEEPK